MNLGFVPNKKQVRFVVNTILHEIPNSFMTFPEDDGGYAIVASLKHEHGIIRFIIWNLNRPTVNVFSCKREKYVNIKLKY